MIREILDRAARQQIADNEFRAYGIDASEQEQYMDSLRVLFAGGVRPVQIREWASSWASAQLAEVLVEGSFFPAADLPSVLGNFMRASNEHASETKRLAIRMDAQAATIQRVRDLHHPEPNACECGESHGTYCSECPGYHPCATIRALDGGEE